MILTSFVRELGAGRVLRGDVRLPDGPPPRSAVVVLHGFKGFKDWGFFPHVAEALAADGHAVVSFNFSGSGIGQDPVRFTDLDAFAANTLSRELEEVERVVGWLRAGELTPRRPDRIGLLGHSRGGGDAVLYAGGAETTGDADAAGPAPVDALVTWAAVADFDRWSAETRAEWRARGRIYVLNGRTGEQVPLDVALLEDFEANRERLDVLAAAARVRVPWLVVHGQEDDTVDPAEARRLADAAPGTARLLEVGGHHGFGAGHPFTDPPASFVRALDETRRHFRAHLWRG